MGFPKDRDGFYVIRDSTDYFQTRNMENRHYSFSLRGRNCHTHELACIDFLIDVDALDNENTQDHFKFILRDLIEFLKKKK